MQLFERLVSSTNGKKTLGAVSGSFMAGWLVLHVLGNFTAFEGPSRMDGYAAALRGLGSLLWLVRGLLVAAVAVHVVVTVSLARRARAARPVHATRRWPRSHVASRTAIVGGPLLLVFVTYHLLHMTFGVARPAFDPRHVHANLVSGLVSPLVATVYVFGALLVGFHLHRGLASALASVGSTRATSTTSRAVFAAIAVLVAAGFAAIPIAVLAGVVR
ncbi:MAG TPA: hypothetical protein VH062_28710 [Polyangiaceae bacterium]|jgi:succinate dehydrogenase / fumarate reductase cytochrome b subunit|nr:hypothetical protein [Polyangiaceae bacterium]